ncbi:hypothetical protein [Streptomyces phaeochromogenes]|uniref:hypothetical protein n=1 Tax=Streptomyces phaeochromogenes TaxID=1923 RepID=UPI003724257F
MADNDPCDSGTNPRARLSMAGRRAALVGLLLMLWVPMAGSAEASQPSGMAPAAVTAPVADPCEQLPKDSATYKYCKGDDADTGGDAATATPAKDEKGKDDNCRLLDGQAYEVCKRDSGGGDDPCDAIKGPAKAYCERGDSDGPPGTGGAGGGLTDGAVTSVRDLADSLIGKIKGLVAPGHMWAPEKADNGLYEPFLWLGQHLAVAIFTCVVVVCALTAWQGVPRLRQMGASTGWTLAAVAGMASVPGIVMLLNRAVSEAFTVAFSSDEGTLFGVISRDMEDAADKENPLALLIIFSALVVALAFAVLVFMTRQLGILAFVCLAPVVLASLARGGDTDAVKRWATRLLGLMFAPFALLLVSPFAKLTEGSLVVDSVLLIAADALMLRMIFHGVPYFGPRIARGARAMVEARTNSPLARAVVRAGAPDVYEQENKPRGPRTVDTPGRAMSQDRGLLFAAYGISKPGRSGRLTTESAVAKTRREQSESAARRAQIRQIQDQYQTPRGRRAGDPAAPPSPTRNPVPPPNTGPTPAPPTNP